MRGFEKLKKAIIESEDYQLIDLLINVEACPFSFDLIKVDDDECLNFKDCKKCWENALNHEYEDGE